MAKTIIKADIGLENYTPLDLSLADFKLNLDALATGIGADETTAKVYIEYESDPYDSGGWFNAYVYRWETDEEEAAREAKEKADREAATVRAIRRQEARERATYAALKAKFEG